MSAGKVHSKDVLLWVLYKKKEQMTLHEAIEIVLQETGIPMTTREIADVVIINMDFWTMMQS